MSRLQVSEVTEGEKTVEQTVFISVGPVVTVVRNKQDNDIKIVITSNCNPDGETFLSMDEAKDLIGLIHAALALAEKVQSD